MGFQMQIWSILRFSWSILVKCWVHLRTTSSKTQILLLQKNIFTNIDCFVIDSSRLDVPPRETSLEARCEKKRLFLQAKTSVLLSLPLPLLHLSLAQMQTSSLPSLPLLGSFSIDDGKVLLLLPRWPAFSCKAYANVESTIIGKWPD